MIQKMIVTGLSAALALSLPSLAQQRPKVGVGPLPLTESEYVFDTAEQHKILATVVIDLFKLAERLRQRHVLISLGNINCFFGTPHLHGVMIGYAHCASESLSTGLAILSEEIRRN